MSDDEEIAYIKRPKTVHYGSLEEQERAKLADEGGVKNEDPGEGSSTSASDPGIKSKLSPPNSPEKVTGNINVSDDYFDLEEELSKEKQALLEEFERKKRANRINVSTDDAEVRKYLRQLGEPQCLFGEGPADRRNRLKDLLSKYGEDAIKTRNEEQQMEPFPMDRETDTTWYHEGTTQLKLARQWLADYSIPRSHDRLVQARAEKEEPATVRTARRQEVQKRLQSIGLAGSQVGDTRPISYCSFSPCGNFIATASWSGLCRVWSVPNCDMKLTLRGHTCNVGSIVFHPEASLDDEEDICGLVSCSADGEVRLWSMKKETSVGMLQGHSPYRVSRVAFHPSGHFLATCCFDHSWRLWDLDSQHELLHQEGHSKPVYCASFQGDGALIATGGLDSFARVWDLRSGRCIMFMEGHLGGILSIAFSPDGYEVATASEDHTAKIWDVRKRACTYTLPAHNSLVSNVRFHNPNGNGGFLLTASYDGTTKIWSEKTWQPLRTLAGHDGKIMGLDLSPDNQIIATSSFDRTFKLWMAE